MVLDDPELLHESLRRRPAVVLVNDPNLVPTLALHGVVVNGRPTVPISKCFLVWT